MIDKKDCTHNDVFFGSGDYYIFCKNCLTRWVTTEKDSDMPCPTNSNYGVGIQLSGEERTTVDNITKLKQNAAIGEVVWHFIDRMNDICESDPADNILKDFVNAVDPAIEAALPKFNTTYSPDHTQITETDELLSVDELFLNLTKRI